MADSNSVPAAQYLRMSSEHQQYSLDNQADRIAAYAASHSFCVIKTYEDAGKSGLLLKQRMGLRALLNDVVSGKPPFKAILVYDVSRWGRFQDTDEAAHYEFICKSAGVPVIYCAETFPNDGSFPSIIMKTLKRTMAGEFSRDLSAKCYDGQKRQVLLGHHLGSIPGFGLRRMLIDATGEPKMLLRDGERKNLATDRVVLVPGPPEEVAVVREIYNLFLRDRMKAIAIGRELNRRSLRRNNGWAREHDHVSLFRLRQ